MARRSALRWQSLRVAMAMSARRPSLGSTQLKGRDQDGSLDTKSRRLATSILPVKRGQDKWQQKSSKDNPKILCNARATLLESEKKMPYVQDSFSLLGAGTAHIHRPTQGWTVREYILLCKVSLLHSPSSLGLDGHEQLLSRLEDAQKAPKEPSSPCLLIGFPCTAS